MFGKRKDSMHGRPSRRSTRRQDAWSSSVVGSHARRQTNTHTHTSRSTGTHRRPSSQRVNTRSGEINQIHFQSRSVDERTARHQTGGSSTATFMRRRDRMRYVVIALVVLVVVAIALTLGNCAFRGSVSSSMALDDPEVSNALVASASDTDPFYVLLAGISDTDPAGETASYTAVLRVDVPNKTISLLNIPSAISETYDNAPDSATMLRDAPYAVNEGELVRRVSGLIEQDINHYVRITDSDFVALVDALGGLQVNVDTYVDDPTVGTVVLDPGEQTLNGEQALAYVSAKNYSSGFEQRSSIQNEIFTALIGAIQDKGGIGFAMSADTIAGKIKTDMSYDVLNSIAGMYGDATIYSAVVPGSDTTAGDSVYWSVGSTFSQVLDKFKSGQDMNISVDTSGVDKSAVSITVLNGAGIDGYSAQAAGVLTNNGFKVDETGNAESFVYDETLVIYREEKDKTAAEAIVQALGKGRTVSAGVYYSLKTDVQVVVGKDWTNV